jgi:DNA-binding response OmpR family regulator
MIEDDKQLCALLEGVLEAEGHAVDFCHDGEYGLRQVLQSAHDLVLLDRMLPELDGLTILRLAREKGVNTPILMLTALGSVDDRVDGLEVGADDYITKPFATRELIARINALGRRPQKWSTDSTMTFGDLIFDPAERVLSSGGASLHLSKREGDLFTVLVKNDGRPLNRAAILTYVWGSDAEVEDGNLDCYIHFLRRHLKELDSVCQIATVRNVGYQIKDGERHVS